MTRPEEATPVSSKVTLPRAATVLPKDRYNKNPLQKGRVSSEGFHDVNDATLTTAW